MRTFRVAILACFAFLLLILVSCGGGTSPVTGGITPLPDPSLSHGINTGGVEFDGTLFVKGIAAPAVAPGTSHLVVIDPPSGPSDQPMKVTASAGSWFKDGVQMGPSMVTTERALEWHAPLTQCTVQLLFEPVDRSLYFKLGIVIEVSNEPQGGHQPPAPYDRELAFNDPLTGKTIVAAEGELLVKLAPQSPITDILALRSAQDYQFLERIDRRAPLFRVKFNSNVNLASALQELRSDPRIAVVEPNYIAYLAVVPDDPQYGEKFEFPKIDAEQAWDLETGSSDVWVAVVDTGVDRDHPDLAGNVMPGADFISNGDGLGGETPGDGIDNNQDGVVDGNVGHGSHVAGIIAAEAFNGVGACGVAYNTKILPLRIFPANGDTGATFSSIIEAIGYAAEQANVRVISMSIGTTYESSLLQEAVTNAWDAGKVLVAAAANANTNSRYYPGAHEHVVAVAALNKTGQKASFSNYGDWVDISAYGTGIFSTTFNDTYAYMSGTSMACPLVSGCMALLFGYMPSLTNEQAVEFLLQYSDDVDTLNPDYAGQLGSGIVNPYLAMTALENDKPGEVSDGNSEGSFSGTDLELGPYTQR